MRTFEYQHLSGSSLSSLTTKLNQYPDITFV